MYENLVVIFITDRYFTCQCIGKNNKFLALTGKTPVELKVNGWSFLLLTGTLPVSVIEKYQFFKKIEKVY